jgi:hypothetical protein
MKDFAGLQEVIEHLRGCHVSFIGRPGSPGQVDGHGHMWYCFDCDSCTFSNHRSYDSDKAMWDHLNQNHDAITDCIVRLETF